MAKMNSTSLYITTTQIILKSEPNNPSTWQDLYRLVPYLRNSLCCVVCGNLLVDPLSPGIGRCQHHLCRRCKGGRKRIKPACSFCKDNVDYTENKSLRILLQCYKKMCSSLINSPIFRGLKEQANKTQATGVERGAGNLILLIREGASFHDEYTSSGGLPKSTYSILPCVYTNSSTQTLQPTVTSEPTPNNVITSNNVQSRPSLYSVLYGSGNKITIKRKPKESTEVKNKCATVKKEVGEKAVFKKPPSKCNVKPKRGCRCGNATATPGKLTCCGQRCPCYVDGKACIECKCRGCRNPHRPDGNKVRPHIPELSQIQYLPTPQIQQPTIVDQDLYRDMHNVVKINNLDPSYTSFDSQRFKTYKGVLNSMQIPTNILLNGPIIQDEEEEPEITVV
ncbi:E3 ubiquitin-protein ligase MSL2 isoform X2 [Aethina tumida]|uniref:E3 ubiquitin-protein ligase MSL2 isoform X2 n=1 Tax=Aethina tumida TaxID=116153 RepID=UPI00096B3F69|nr:E3 ubiquitin-protein ligase MSL2 isoform X2 [Aethina tumida]